MGFGHVGWWARVMELDFNTRRPDEWYDERTQRNQYNQHNQRNQRNQLGEPK